MGFYTLLIFALTLACVAAVEFYYMMFLEGVIRQHKRRIAELEQENRELTRELEETETLSGQSEEAVGEVWPEVVDEDDFRVR